MKKIIFTILALIVLSGCSFKDMSNTPTKQVEAYLNNYQTLSSNVIEKLDSIVNLELDFSDSQKDTYKDILKKHYQDLVYTIKEETVNGDQATVEVEIEVNDYSKVLKEAETYRLAHEQEFLNDDNVFDTEKFNDYKLELLKSNKDRVKYTLYLSLNKVNDKWVLENLTKTEEDKILGIYEY